ncbi:SRPBCC family protein [Pseudanabaena yagii]|uniref:Polyketide cyclase n=1 Tax=Pseudanabaena yagii GIHE-NHR1 TaxID=2722753 RepID=A0ABX1LTC7_9CYAN|nr:SRPBCC family protein [Pseudanabaena yagii]NMF59402.1 polyketide cyclase [Pseudanabaena yagii GIHE-NHR1]
MSLLSATIKTTVRASQVEVFEHIAPIDLTSIFKGYGLLPSVIGTQNQIGSWDTEGQTRTVHLSDNSSVQEMLTKYEHPHYFSYTVSSFTGSLRFLATSANGEWWFSGGSSGQTNIKWRYTFNARSFLAFPILWLITNLLWRNYMYQALQLSKSQIEHDVI